MIHHRCFPTSVCRLAALFLAMASPAMSGEAASVWRYVIKPGDTLISIAGRYLARPADWPRIQENNDIADPYRILPGTAVRIPASMLRREPGTARLEKIHGGVRWHDGNGEWRAASDGLRLAAGAVVETGEDSSALLLLADGSRIILAPHSVLELDTLSVFAGGLMVDTRLHLPRGQTDVQANPERRRNLRIRTPSAQAVVRGTHFRLEADETASREETLSGVVSVTAAGRRVTIPAGKGTLVKAGKPPIAPVALLPAADVSSLPTRFEILPMRFDLPQLAGATEWHGLIAPDREPHSILASKRTRSAHLTFADLPNGSYVLALRAIDVNGLSGRDALHRFTVFARPFPPALKMPGDGAVVRSARPGFAWGNVLEASRYRFQVAADAAFSSLLEDAVVAAESGEAGRDLPPGPLFWRVATLSEAGEQGPWSQPAAFVYRPGPGPVDLGQAALRVDHERVALFLPPVSGMGYEAFLAADRDLRTTLARACSDDDALELTSPGSGSFYLGVRLVDLSDGTPGPASVQKIDIPADGRPWLWLLLLPLLALL
ncbi:MAG: FecR domain-containing protein [Candidatus Accumulibacter sp.]|jgi:hypothetical protein|nr:FecR domain-containing protein [Accumulibacter sp.]